jgi:hypothetical protein
MHSVQSYQDFQIKDVKAVSRDEQAIRFDKNSKKKERKFVEAFSKSFSDVIKNTDIDKFPTATKPAVKKMSGTDKKSQWYGANTNNVLATAIASSIIKNVDKKNFTNSDVYMQRVYYSYFLNKNKIVEELKTKLCKSINGGLGLKTKQKVKGKQVVAMLNVLLPQIDATMRQNLMELVAKRKEKFSGPLPLPN